MIETECIHGVDVQEPCEACQKNTKTVHVYVSGGIVQEVTNLPKGWKWELHDEDGENECEHLEFEENGDCKDCTYNKNDED